MPTSKPTSRAAARPSRIDVFVEAGTTKVFAGALEWPGWCRSARDEPAALQALIDYVPRYARALRPTVRGFKPPTAVSALHVAERVRGDATTDFGAPAALLRADAEPLIAAEVKRLTAILRACWDAFGASVKAAGSRELRKGPRGGGRDLAKMKAHLLEAERAYLSAMGGAVKTARPALRAVHDAFEETLDGRVRGKIPDRGPRGGKRWLPRYTLRRAAWHALDHAWEIEDRVES